MCQSSGENLRYTYDFDGDGVEDFRGNCRVQQSFDLSGLAASAVGPARHARPLRAALTKYESVMTVFEPSETARPPVNKASQTNLVTVIGPPPRDLRRAVRWAAEPGRQRSGLGPGSRPGTSRFPASSTSRAAPARSW